LSGSWTTWLVSPLLNRPRLVHKYTGQRFYIYLQVSMYTQLAGEQLLKCGLVMNLSDAGMLIHLIY